MYRPHAAREDTMLFPEFRRIVGEKQYDHLGEMFEEKEHKLFGDHGFEKMVSRVDDIEKEIGIEKLNVFPPA